MNNKNEIVVIYKAVGKKTELKKIKNDLSTFQNLLGNKLNYIQYKDITILAIKDMKRQLQPNIYLNTTMLNIRERNIRGNIIVTCIENGKFKSLTKEQAMQYKKFLQEESFSHNYFDKNVRHIQKYSANKNKSVAEKEIEDNTNSITNNSNQNADTNETLNMILAIQSIILKFVKKNKK